MLAKALAKESGATFINLHVSTLTEKYFGESQKLVHALFSLAQKLAPTIIFIDEIDSFLRERSRGDHEATGMMKAEFMSLWDGLAGQELTRGKPRTAKKESCDPIKTKKNIFNLKYKYSFGSWRN